MSDGIAWSDDYAIGHEVLDAHHKQLFRLGAAVLAIEDPISQTAELRAVLHKLYDYMKYHFSEEERFMVEIGYADLDAHRAMHRDLIGAMNDILRASTDLVQLELNLVDLMNRWLSEHIGREDGKIAKWAREHPPAAGAAD